jgi:hypothetical protein
LANTQPQVHQNAVLVTQDHMQLKKDLLLVPHAVLAQSKMNQKQAAANHAHQALISQMRDKLNADHANQEPLKMIGAQQNVSLVKLENIKILLDRQLALSALLVHTHLNLARFGVRIVMKDTSLAILVLSSVTLVIQEPMQVQLAQIAATIADLVPTQA